jgi:hypothetical protein
LSNTLSLCSPSMSATKFQLLQPTPTNTATQDTHIQHAHPQYSFDCSSIEHLSEGTRNAPW